MLNVTLSPQSNDLNTVVVVGYGTQKKRDLTGSVASVSAKDITAVATTNALQAVQGKVAGVDIRQDNWRPGATSTIRIRGNRSINAGNEPLYVIDGIPMGRGGITVNDINPADIESLEVLKDASSTAIYGSRGANGVVLITTKRGKSGKSFVEYNGYEGIQRPLRTVDVFSAAEYADYVREAFRNVTGANKYLSPVPDMEEDKKLSQFNQDPYVLESVLMGYDDHGNYDPSKVRGFDWMDAVMQNGNIRSHQLSLRGGSEKTKAMVSAGYFGNRGLVKNMEYERYNIRLNLDHSINDWLKLTSSTMLSRANENIGTNLYNLARQTNPLASPYGPDGQLQLNPGNDPLTVNPILDIDGIISDSRKDRILTNLGLEAKILDGLRYRVNLGYDYRTARDGRIEKFEIDPTRRQTHLCQSRRKQCNRPGNGESPVLR